MIGNPEKEGEFNFANVVDFLIKFRKPIIITTLLAGFLAVIFSGPYFIHPKYKSSVILYPTRTNSIARALLSTTADQLDLLAFGQENEAEQLLQLLESDEITNHIAGKYHLMNHYRIDPKADYPNTYLQFQFHENVKYRRTEYMSIEIVVLDEDRDTAAMMANDIATYLDTVKTHLQQHRAAEALHIVKARFEEKEKFINSITDSLRKLGEYGVLNYEEQPAVLTEQYARALMSGNTKVALEIKEQEKMLAKYGPTHKKLMDEIKSEVNQLTDIESKMHQAQVDAEQNLPHKFVISGAVPSEKKAFPVRSIIVGLCMLSAFAFSVIVCALISNFKKYNLGKRLSIVSDEKHSI